VGGSSGGTGAAESDCGGEVSPVGERLSVGVPFGDSLAVGASVTVGELVAVGVSVAGGAIAMVLRDQLRPRCAVTV
jgi:hypothetical protein